ncbi:sulfur carrier protein ThiS [Amycolatopsis sp. FDAARGOS 1241]|uniref:sulfur carrier protein ThiS n=1 Tax=Amycolatopsis sp. FDAARGOS 1241 TaxID=2778070 RepID=UPI00194F92FA|nr:sulfur carrier protein ThiS [Amycolatopsis sp. FDAARGOS 1241]QRP46709.1 sulfur carrier protein ThiS [Amycolatopsis sp. FDAARGOS 1241]
MEIKVNGDWREFPDGATVAQLLDALDVSPQGVAVAVNGVVVRRGEWGESVVPKGANIDVLTAVQGG